MTAATIHRLSFDQLTYFGHAPARWYLAEALICAAAWCLAMAMVRAGRT